jgi:hypothetical protein
LIEKYHKIAAVQQSRYDSAQAFLSGAIVIDGRPRFAKPPINDSKKVKIAAIDPDFN